MCDCKTICVEVGFLESTYTFMPDLFTFNTSNNSVDIDTAQEVWPLVVDNGMSFWRLVAFKISNWSQAQNMNTVQLTIVLPFVQLIAPLRYAWGQVAGDGFLPRMETTQTWAARMGGVHQAGAGPSMDPVLDHLQAKKWLEQLGSAQAFALTDALAEPLVLMTTDFVQAAGAVPIKERDVYWEKAEQIAQRIPAGIAGVEAALGPLAIAWAKATEKWSIDVLFDAAEKSHGLKGNLQKAGLVVLQAGGEDTLTKNLYLQWEEHSRLWFDLDEIAEHKADTVITTMPRQASLFDDKWAIEEQKEVASEHVTQFDPLRKIAEEHPPRWQVAKDAEDEAELAAAQVIRLLNDGVAPIALCSQDRPIARRVWALLQRQNIALADETGWTLSTTRCAALVMGLVNAAAPDATPDTVLDVFKGLPPEQSFIQGLDLLEKHLRVSGTHQWPQQALPQWDAGAEQVLQRINNVLNKLHGSDEKTLWGHLQALGNALKSSMAWSVLIGDEAGREVLQVLHLQEAEQAVDRSMRTEMFSDFKHNAQHTPMSYQEFMQWVNRTLESVTFIPIRPDAPQVVLTPLARVMLRPFPAVVIPGCDDSRLTAPPSLPGFWGESDRQTLGLMNIELWWTRLQAQWMQALRLPQVFLIWRSAEGSQPLGPATLVQRVLPQASFVQDQRDEAVQVPKPTWVPAPQPAERFPVHVLSASSYKKLRDCPYQFYAEHLLQLRQQDELDMELTRRDYGNWLHAVLRQFHLKRTSSYPQADQEADCLLLDTCAAEHAAGLDQASLVPWQARWPVLRDAYLHWLQHHESEGGRFMKGEFSMQYSLQGKVVLQGRIDRLDEQQGTPVLMDYKTERRNRTAARVKDRYEEIQLPFYALLAQGNISQEPDAVIANAAQAQAVYLSLDDREETVEPCELDALEELKGLLAQSILHDVDRLKTGFPLYPLGQAQTCSYCHVNGLCRKGYWTEVKSATGKDIEGKEEQG